MSDYKKKYTDLVNYIPARYRSVAGTSILRNLHNKFLTKEESTQMLGYVGDLVRNDTSPYIPAANLDREINALIPAVYTKLGAEEHIFTFSDVLQKMKMLGVDLSKFGTWGAATSFNFVPPINLDRFTNYSRYRWYGHLIGGTAYNAKMDPEYYVIGASGVSDWATINYWIHEEDANAFFVAKGYAFTIDSTIQAVRPIIEYDVKLEQSMVLFITPSGQPNNYGTEVDQTAAGYKTEFNQKPLFNLYLQNSQHSGFVSPIFYYAEGNDYPVDAALKTRIVKDNYGDFTFEQGLISKDGKRTLFYKIDNNLNSIWKKGPVESPVYVEQGAAGAWKYPNQMFHNITHENRKQVGYGDLLGHFTDIISKQPNFAGNPFGINNFRSLNSYELGNGGRIKDYDTNFGLFLGLSNQLDTSIPSIIEFGKIQYSQLLGSIREFVTRNFADAINDGKIFAPRTQLSNDIDPALAIFYKDFLSAVAMRNDASVFSDTTSSIVGWVATIPYLGLGAPSKPSIYFESRLGSLMLRHHDSHVSKIDTQSIDIEKNIANMMFLRSDSQTTPGVSGYIAPARPYKNQFWFDANTDTLKYFNVKSDTQPIFPAINGDLFYSRAQNKLFMFENEVFIDQGDVSSAWTVVNVSTVVSQLTLMIENQLFVDCPFDSVKIDVIRQLDEDSLQTNTLLEQELATYAAKHDLDLYAGDYSPTDAFTWNYKLASISTLPPIARWFEIYQSYLGTRKPNLEPWKLTGFSVKPDDWDERYADTTGTRLWTTQMWIDIKAVCNKKLCVDVETDDMLPPYVSASESRSSEALLTSIPLGISNHYVFNDNGPTEFNWRISVDFSYDVLKTCFRIDPVRFVNTVWGYNNIEVNGYSIDRHEHRNLSHREYLLHGEAPTPKFNGYKIDNLVINSIDDKVWTLICVGNAANGSIFQVKGDFSGIITREYIVNTQFISAQIRFVLQDNGSDFNIGDKVVINAMSKHHLLVPSKYCKFNGLNQWFVNLNRYNSVDMSIALSDNILRDWDLKLGYRMSGLVNTELLKIRTDQFPLNNTGFDVVIKQNKGISDHWLNAIRIQLIRIGTTVLKDGKQVPHNKGADWVFRIETFNPHNPNISYYEYDKTGKYLTFNAFDKENSLDEWKTFKSRTGLITKVAPFTVTGIQNVANIIFGYVDRLNEEGWRFNQGKEPVIDIQTGRVVNWQMFIEQFIDQQYLGVDAGTGIILNPFATNVWFKTPHGFVSNMRNASMTDVISSQIVFDSFGAKIHESDIQVFRNDEVTEIQSAVVIGGMHLVVDEYEHIALFNDYIFDKSRQKLIYDPFLGVRVNRIHIAAERQTIFNGRLSFGGHYIKDHKVVRNIEASITDMLNYYDGDKMIDSSQTAKHARGLLGYDPKTYMTDIDLTDKSQFGFWRGLVSNKGSNLSVNAFLNSARFESAKIDEFWAYKLAEFGDARQLAFPEIKLSSTDTQHNYTKVNFTGLGLADQSGFINISNSDESRWVSADDLNQNVSFVAEKLAELVYEVNPDNAIHDIVSNGKKIIVDSVQVFLEVALTKLNGDNTPFLVPVTNFVLVNSSTIKFNLEGFDLSAENYNVKYTDSNTWKFIVRCFGPSQPKFNPAKLIDYKNKVIISDLGLWDPARGSHTSEALEIVDMISPIDPAKFNYSVRTSNNVNYDAYRSWDKKDIGRVWWNTRNLEYIPYSDKQIFPNLDTRLSYWGALADYSKIELYEWTESSVHPSKYAELVNTQEGDSSIPADIRASGEVALSELYTRKRTWRQRPIAWGYTDEPGSVVPYLSSVGESRVKFTSDLTGGTIAILSSSDWIGTFSNLSIGMKISGGLFHYNPDDVSDTENFKLSKPYGEAVVTGLNQDVVIGSSSSFDSPKLVPIQHIL